jgi:hypothetical protein
MSYPVHVDKHLNDRHIYPSFSDYQVDKQMTQSLQVCNLTISLLKKDDLPTPRA